MPTPEHDADDTQPFRNSPKVNHRHYVPATWVPPGTGGGSPKIGGGYSVDNRSGEVTPNAYNRPDQRFELPQSTIQSRRSARADAEYADAVILLGEQGLYEVRSPTGNNYDVGSTLVTCDCPDWKRLDDSGYGLLRCKHIYLVMKALADPGLPNGLLWSCAKMAEFIGITERTVQELCEEGLLTATKKHNVWVIEPLDAPIMGRAYASKIMFHPLDWSVELPYTELSQTYDSGAQEWTVAYQLENTAAYELQGQIRLIIYDTGIDNTFILEDGFTGIAEPVNSPYVIVQEEAVQPGDIVTGSLSFHNPTGSSLTYSAKVYAGSGLI